MYPAVVADCETTGVFDFKLPADAPSQPRVVAVAAALIEETGDPIEAIDHIIRPDGWTIPFDAARIHGITTEIATEKGIPIPDALGDLNRLLDKARLFVAFGVAFDLKAFRSEFRRAGFPDRYGDLPDFDVMRACTPLCKIPPTSAMMASGRNWFKTPTLSEACEILLGRKHDRAHSAMGDVAVTVELYRFLASKGLVKPKKRESTHKAGSSKGRTPDFGSGNAGSTPAPAAGSDEAF